MLEIWDAERLDSVLMSGRTRPLIIECSRQAKVGVGPTLTGLKRDRRTMVVKAVGLPEVTQESLFREVFGNLVARELGVGTPTPALVNLSPQFVEAVKLHLLSYDLHLEPGIGAGCEYFRHGFTNVVLGAHLTAEELAQAVLIYGFDLLVQNPDRTEAKPNCAFRSGQFVAYDFELAFSFLLLVGAQSAPWEVSKHGIGRDHLFTRSLRSRNPDWKPFIAALRRLTRKRLKQLVDNLPEEWRNSAERICVHLLAVKKNLAKLELELQRSLL